MRTIAYFSLLLLLLACDRSSTLRYDEISQGEQLVSIAFLRSLCRGDSHPITRPLIIQGAVTANDLFGEYEKTLVVEDRSGGIEIQIDASFLAKDYPIGTPLTIFCNGLALGDYGGEVILGKAPTTIYVVDRIPQQELTRFIRIDPLVVTPIHAQPLCFEQLCLPLVGSYVCFEEIRFAEEEVGHAWCNCDPETGAFITTQRHLVDGNLDTLQVRVLASCTYATEPVPSGTGSVSGILSYFNRAYQLRITNRTMTFPAAAIGAKFPTTSPSTL
ncbi:MAG: DUF5689 domain-containing protein [Alistipes sp.]